MGKLRESADEKIAAQHRQSRLKRDEEAERKNAMQKLQQKIQLARQDECFHIEEIEREARARRGVVDSETHAGLYRLEETCRMRLRSLESALSVEAAAARTGSVSEQQHKRSVLEAGVRIKRQRIEKEIEEEKSQLMAQDRLKKSSIDAEAQMKRIEAAAERQRANRLAEQWYGDCLNEMKRMHEHLRSKKQ